MLGPHRLFTHSIRPSGSGSQTPIICKLLRRFQWAAKPKNHEATASSTVDGTKCSLGNLGSGPSTAKPSALIFYGFPPTGLLSLGALSGLAFLLCSPKLGSFFQAQLLGCHQPEILPSLLFPQALWVPVLALWLVLVNLILPSYRSPWHRASCYPPPPCLPSIQQSLSKWFRMDEDMIVWSGGHPILLSHPLTPGFLDEYPPEVVTTF